MMDRSLLRWPVDAETISARIAGTRADLKIVLKTRDERELIEKWILHHLVITGPQGLVIFDNDSSDPDVLAVYARYADAVQIFGWDLNYNFIHAATRLRRLYDALRASCRYYAVLDTDEFASWTDGGWLHRDGIVDRLANDDGTEPTATPPRTQGRPTPPIATIFDRPAPPFSTAVYTRGHSHEPRRVQLRPPGARRGRFHFPVGTVTSAGMKCRHLPAGD